jgi:hypothetical protein
MRSVSLLQCVSLVLLLALPACERAASDTTRESDESLRESREERDRSLPGPAPTLRPRRPPPEAYAACDGLHDGSSCTVTLQGRTLAGSCVPPPNGDGKPACLPADFGRRELSGRELERKLDRLEREIQGT